MTKYVSLFHDDLADAINDYWKTYTKEVRVGMNKAVDKVAGEVNKEIKSHILFHDRTGQYRKAFRIKSVPNGLNNGKVWHVAEPHYRLTHLLENGHALKGGGRARAFPHIKYGEELAKRRMEELTMEVIRRANGS